MAKKAIDERPFRPVDESLVRAVLHPPVAMRDVNRETPETMLKHAGLPGPSPSVGEDTDNARPQSQATLSISPRNVETQNKTIDIGKLQIEKRLLLTRAETRAIERFVATLAGEVGTPIKFSHVLRACTTLILNAEREVLQRARETEKLIRPPNGDVAALQEFERSLARILDAAFKDAKVLN